MPIPTPPKDQSGGYVMCSITDGAHTHRHKFHVDAFDASTGDYTSPSGTEANVGATFAAYASHVKNFYSSDWVLVPVELWYRDPATDEFTLTGYSLGASVNGAGTAPADAIQYNSRQITLSMATSKSLEKFRLIYIAANQIGWRSTPDVSSGSGGDIAGFDALVTYLLSSGCKIRAHNGDKPRGSGRFVFSWNRRLRRKYGWI